MLTARLRKVSGYSLYDLISTAGSRHDDGIVLRYRLRTGEAGTRSKVRSAGPAQGAVDAVHGTGGSGSTRGGTACQQVAEPGTGSRRRDQRRARCDRTV
ncbi:hypothetical protein GCM10010360_65020 [Streptomyces nogalater]